LRMNWDNIQVLAIWILGSLFAIAIIGDQPYLGIAVAILAGVAVGISHLLAFDKAEARENRDQAKEKTANPSRDQERT
jgi:hypothetical protein